MSPRTIRFVNELDTKGSKLMRQPAQEAAES